MQLLPPSGHPPIMKPKTLACKICNRGFWTIYGRDRHARSAHGPNAKNKGGSNCDTPSTTSSSSRTKASTASATTSRVTPTSLTASTAKTIAKSSAPEVDLTEEKENNSTKNKKGSVCVTVLLC